MKTKTVIISILIFTLIYCVFSACSEISSRSNTSPTAQSLQEESLQTLNTEATSAETVIENEELLQETEFEKTNEVSDEGKYTTGASSISELVGFLEGAYLFTPQQVDCMSVEFLFACLYTADPINAADMFETRDLEAIAALLNERLFQEIGCQPVLYRVFDYQVNVLTDEVRQQVQEWFMESYSQVVEQYGEYFAEKVSEENEGREQMITLVYTATDSDGNEVALPGDLSNGLVFSKVNGRYYWNDFSIFKTIDG